MAKIIKMTPELREECRIAFQAEFEKAINTLAERPKRIKTVNEQPWKDVGIRKIRLTSSHG